MTTDLTAKRLLIWPVLAIYVPAHMTLLRRIRALDARGGHPSFGGVPGDLLRDVTQVGRSHVGIHGSCFVTHGGNRKLFIGELTPFMLLEAEIDCPVDLLPHMTEKALACCAGSRRELFLWYTLLFQAFS